MNNKKQLCGVQKYTDFWKDYYTYIKSKKYFFSNFLDFFSTIFGYVTAEYMRIIRIFLQAKYLLSINLIKYM